MQHGLTRNRTYELLADGHYSNIRTYKRSEHLRLRDEDALPFVLPPPAPPGCMNANGRFGADVPTCYNGWQISNASTVDEFSAACWFTAQVCHRNFNCAVVLAASEFRCTFQQACISPRRSSLTLRPTQTAARQSSGLCSQLGEERR
eukprot:SAG31_NODE_2726_length_5182_cov_1.523903_4_plen_147_part_00